MVKRPKRPKKMLTKDLAPTKWMLRHEARMAVYNLWKTRQLMDLLQKGGKIRWEVR